MSSYYNVYYLDVLEGVEQVVNYKLHNLGTDFDEEIVPFKDTHPKGRVLASLVTSDVWYEVCPSGASRSGWSWRRGHLNQKENIPEAIRLMSLLGVIP